MTLCYLIISYDFFYDKKIATNNKYYTFRTCILSIILLVKRYENL